MKNAKRRSSRRLRRAATPDDASLDTGGLLQTVGVYETGNGLAHGVLGVGIAIVLALLVRPIVGIVRAVTRR